MTSIFRIILFIVIGTAVGISPNIIIAAETPLDAAEEIPGTPIDPRYPINDTVGGNVVDRVYELKVTGPSLVLVGLNGETGSELGLYAFGSASTSVLTDNPLATSAKPGGQQFISLRFTQADVLYININGRNRDRAYSYSLSIRITRDTTPPRLEVTDFPSRTRSSSVCIKVRAIDSLSGIGDIAIWEQSNSIPLWQPFRLGLPVCQSISAGNRRTNISVRVRNLIGIESRTVSFPITIDDKPPVITSISPKSGFLLQALSSVRLDFDSRLKKSTITSDSVKVVDQFGSPVDGLINVSRDRKSIVWNNSDPTRAGTQLMMFIHKLEDRAGNLMAEIAPITFSRKRRTTLAVATRESQAGYERTINGSMNLRDQNVLVEYRSTREWLSLGRIKVGSKIPQRWLQDLQGEAVRIRFEGTELLAPTSVKFTLP
jgi:hypothetical protein